MIPVKVKYFEEGPSWAEKRSTSSSAAATASSLVTKGGFSVCTMDLSCCPSPNVDVDTLVDVLAASVPTFVFIHNATPAARQSLMQSPFVRKSYGITDFVRYEPREGVDRGTVCLLRVGVHCDGADNATRQFDSGAVRLCVLLQFRALAGVSASVAALLVEAAAPVGARVSAFAAASSLFGACDAAAICSNLTESVGESAARELTAARLARGFADAAEETGERAVWPLWVKSAKLAPTHVPSETAGKGGPLVAIAAVAPRGGTTIAIPQPRSAKSGNAKGSSPAATPAAIVDPAILSAEAGGGRGAGRSGAAIIERLLQQQQQSRWRAAQGVAIKGGDKLSASEALFDVTPHFASAAEVVEALNSKAIHWPADFCVAHSTLLVSEAVGQGDRRAMFRRYAREHKHGASLIPQMFAVAPATSNSTTNASSNNNSSPLGALTGATATTTANASANVALEKTSWSKSLAALSGHATVDVNGEDNTMMPMSWALRREEEQRNRIWDVSWCTIVYQVTPREMKFNITQAVGVGKDNLKEAIQYLNFRSQPKLVTPSLKENPLINYSYDYALLFSVEMQGYWLIAATHVPCDIVACRAAA